MCYATTNTTMKLCRASYCQVLLYTPKDDRDATFVDVSAAAENASAAWMTTGAGENFTVSAPDGHTRFETTEQSVLVKWLQEATGGV
jgi:hypothetical protein